MKRLKCQRSYCSECVHRGCKRTTPTTTPPPHHNHPAEMLKRMTTEFTWHITASHKALGRLCERRRQAGRKSRLSLSFARPLSLSLSRFLCCSSVNVRHLCCCREYLFSAQRRLLTRISWRDQVPGYQNISLTSQLPNFCYRFICLFLSSPPFFVLQSR